MLLLREVSNPVVAPLLGALLVLGGCSDPPGPVTLDAGDEQDAALDAGKAEPDVEDAAMPVEAGMDASPDAAPDAAGHDAALDAEVDAGPIDFGMPGLDARVSNTTCIAPKNGQPMPALLSQTGCFDASDPTRPVASLIPFDVNAALWSDYADKLRWISLPDGKTVDLRPDGDFLFPEGTILLKTFMLSRRLETRFFIHHEGDPGLDGGLATEAAWTGYAYKWREDGSDADLIQLGDEGAAFEVPGPDGMQTWTIPVGVCGDCHNRAAGDSLGLELRQLNRDFTYPSTGRTQNQVHTLEQIGVFSEPLGDNREWPQLVPYSDGSTTRINPQATTEEAARSYLHANCSYCHRRPDMPGDPDGPGITEDFRATTDFVDMNSCGQASTNSMMFGLPETLLTPGAAMESALYQRMADPTPLGQTLQEDGTHRRSRMPRIGTTLPHPLGLNIVRAWINQLTECPE